MRQGNTQLKLQRLYEESGSELWEAAGYFPLNPGQFVFVEDGTLSYFDEELMQVVRFFVQSSAQERSRSLPRPAEYPQYNPQSQKLGGGCLLMLGLGLLLFLATSMDNPVNQTPEGVEAGTYLVLIALGLLFTGLYLRVRSRRNRS